jgi:DNA replication and repair protein RecF
MALSAIKLANFRSYTEAEFKFDPKLSIIVGPNGCGKTNLLESVYVLARGRSWRARDPELVKHGQTFYKLAADEPNQELRYQTNPKTKTYLLKQKPVRWLDYHDQLPVVLFEPRSMEIITGAPAGRRDWLDGILVASNRNYLKNVLKYRAILKQRNALLKQPSLARAQQQIFAWDIKLVEQADQLTRARQQLVEYINQSVAPMYRKIAAVDVELQFKLSVAYQPSQYASGLLKQLESGLVQDFRFGTTTHGPHRDEVHINFNGRPIASLASRGEQRTSLLVAKMLELKYLSQHTSAQPLLLFDDVYSELDDSRAHSLSELISGYQCLVTTTSLSGIELTKLPAHSVIKLA